LIKLPHFNNIKNVLPNSKLIDLPLKIASCPCPMSTNDEATMLSGRPGILKCVCCNNLTIQEYL
jgi:hypothetical protein